MSRYTAHVRQHDTLTGQFACDAIHVDGGGDLHLSLRHGAGDPVTIARFQHGHWGSYTLDLTAEDEATAAPDNDRPEAARQQDQQKPEAGSAIHFIAPGRYGCLSADVYLVNANDSIVLSTGISSSPYPREFKHDESQQAEWSWHWPCDGDQAVTPEPDAPTQLTINITVHGSVTTDDLIAAVRNSLLGQERHSPSFGPTNR